MPSVLEFQGGISTSWTISSDHTLKSGFLKPLHGPTLALLAVASMKKQFRILAVDDEPIIAESIACGLEAPHRKISVAADGHEALALLAKQ